MNYLPIVVVFLLFATTIGILACELVCASKVRQANQHAKAWEEIADKHHNAAKAWEAAALKWKEVAERVQEGEVGK